MNLSANTTPTHQPSTASIGNTSNININKIDLSRKWSSMISIYDDNKSNININDIKIDNDNNNNADANINTATIMPIRNPNIYKQDNITSSASSFSKNPTLEKLQNDINSNLNKPPHILDAFNQENDSKKVTFDDNKSNNLSGSYDKTNNANIVKKLKQKFDHKDQTFIKVNFNFYINCCYV